MKCHRLGGLNNRNALFHHTGGETSNITCWQGWFFRKAMRVRSVPGLGELWKALACR